MARKKAVVKEAVAPQIVEEGGILYERRILSIQARSSMLAHTDLVRYDKELKDLSWSVKDENDPKGLTTLLFIHEKYVETSPV